MWICKSSRDEIDLTVLLFWCRFFWKMVFEYQISQNQKQVDLGELV